MKNKLFGILLSVINILSFISLEKYWKNGVSVVLKPTAKRKVPEYTQENVVIASPLI